MFTYGIKRGEFTQIYMNNVNTIVNPVLVTSWRRIILPYVCWPYPQRKLQLHFLCFLCFASVNVAEKWGVRRLVEVAEATHNTQTTQWYSCQARLCLLSWLHSFGYAVKFQLSYFSAGSRIWWIKLKFVAYQYFVEEIRIVDRSISQWKMTLGRSSYNDSFVSIW